MEGYLEVLIITFSVKVQLVCSLICKCALNHPLYTFNSYECQTDNLPRFI